MKKLIGTFNEKYNDGNDIIVNLRLKDYTSKKRFSTIEKNKEYQIDIKEIKSQRSLNQNKFLWKIIRDITEYIRATDYDYDEIKVYIDLLKEANCKYEYFIVPNDEAIDKLREVCRAVEFVKMQEVNGNLFKMVKVYIGSSKFNTKEMNELIDNALKLANEFNPNYESELEYDRPL